MTEELKKARKEHIVAGVLAGGTSRRLGRNKAFIEWRGRPLVEGSVLSAKKMTSDVYILAKEQALYKRIGCPVLPDLYSTPSPLSGILSVGPFVKDWLLLLACDIVLFTDRLLPFLWDKREAGKAVVVRSKEGLQPLLGLYPVEHLSYWEKAYKSGNYKLQPVITQMPRVEVAARELPKPIHGGPSFLNINQDADVERLLQLEKRVRVQ